MLDAEEIIAELGDRKTAAGPVLARAREVRDTYNGDIVVPLPEIDEAERVAVANLAQLGIDQTGTRIASVMPAQMWPSLNRTAAAEKRARHRREFSYEMWRKSNLQLKQYRRARWLVAYACGPAVIRPDAEGLPTWQLREPLGTFPAPNIDPDAIVPDDCIFSYRRSRRYLERQYPEQMRMLRKARASTFECVEYIDAEQITLLVMGSPTNPHDPYSTVDGDGGAPWQTLHSLPNRAGVPLATVAGRITLDRPMGQFDGMIGMYQLQAKMMSLNVLATQRAIFPELWLVGDGNMTPEIINEADPMVGEMGVLKGGKIDVVRMEPGVFANPLMDRLEYAERHTAGIPPEFGGSSSTNIRTGRRGDAVLSAVIDFPIQEAQRVLENALEHENRIAVATVKAYAGNKTFSFYSTAIGQYTITPNKTFETDQNTVRYAYAGADADRLTIAGLQRIGAGTLAKESFMEIDPLVEDAEAERDRIMVESLEAAFMSSIQAQAADPNGPYQPEDMALLMNLVKTNKKELAEAVAEVHQRAQERQAAQAAAAAAQQPDQGLMPGMSMPGAPGAPPEMGPLGAGGEATPSIAEPGASIGNLSEMFTQIRRPQMALAPERSPTAAETGAAR